MAIPSKNVLGNPNVTEGNFQIAIEQLRESVIGSGKTYNSANTYMAYDICYYSGVVYYSKIDSNTGNTPSIGANWGDYTDLLLGVVHKTGDETIAGIKSFTDGVKVQNKSVSPFSGFKNYIINGNFYVWQRGTNFIGFGYGASDRFANANGTDQQSKTIYEDKIFLSSVTQSPYGGILTRIENGGFVLNNKTITLSFYFNGVSGDFNNSTVLFTVEGKPQISAHIPNPSIPGRKTITISLPDNTDVIGKYLEIRWWWTNTSTNTRVDIAQVQLEEGSVATPFENRPYGLELSLCQRYYQAGGGYATSFCGNVTQGYSYYHKIYLQVAMRVPPTVVLTDSGGNNNFQATSGAVYSSTTCIREDRNANGTGVGTFQSTFTASAEL